MENVFEDIMKTEQGREVVFNLLSTAMFYRHASVKPHNPLMKQLGSEDNSAYQARKLLFKHTAAFEALIAGLYTPEASASFSVDDLTSASK